MPVKILAECQALEGRGGDYLRVSTCSDPLDNRITLATIQRFVQRQKPKKAGNRMRIRTLILREPMAPDIAVGLARRYAERKNIPVVVTD
jgi:hypothetical protein